MGNYSQLIPVAAMAVKMAPGANPRTDRVPEQDQSGARNLTAMAAEICIVFGKILREAFFVGDDFISVGGRRGGTPGAEAGPTRGQGGVRVWLPPLPCGWPPKSPSGLRVSSDI